MSGWAALPTEKNRGLPLDNQHLLVLGSDSDIAGLALTFWCFRKSELGVFYHFFDDYLKILFGNFLYAELFSAGFTQC